MKRASFFLWNPSFYHFRQIVQRQKKKRKCTVKILYIQKTQENRNKELKKANERINGIQEKWKRPIKYHGVDRETSYYDYHGRMAMFRKCIHTEKSRILNEKNEETSLPTNRKAQNLCKKIYYLSKNNVKNEQEWKSHISELFNTYKNLEPVEMKSLFMLVLGLTKIQYADFNNLWIKDLKDENKKIYIDEIIDHYIKIISNNIENLNVNQLSILLSILQKRKRKDNQFTEVIEIIQSKLTQNKDIRKLNVQCFSNLLQFYSKNLEYYYNFGIGSTKDITCMESKNNKKKSPLKYLINEHTLSNYLNKIEKRKFKIEHILSILYGMHKLKIKDTSIMERIVECLHVQLKQNIFNYFMIPSLLLVLANLKIYHEELYLLLKNNILQNYHFYNSVHITNIFYSFSRMNCKHIQDLFDTLALHIIQNFPKKLDIPERIEGEKKEIQKKNLSSIAIKNVREINDTLDNTTFNMFQITNIINSCLRVNYLNYNLFIHLFTQMNFLSEGRKHQKEETIDNEINYYLSLSRILNSFEMYLYTYMIAYHDIQEYIEHMKHSNYNESNENSTTINSYKYIIYKKEPQTIETYEYRTKYIPSACFFFFVKQKNQPFDEQNKMINQFEKEWNKVRNRIIKKIEKNMHNSNIKFIFHSLMLCLYTSKTQLVNLCILCFDILKNNLEFFTIHNLYFYVKTFHMLSIYHYTLFNLIRTHMRNDTKNIGQKKKKVQFNLLFFDIFKDINPNEFEEIIYYFNVSNHSINVNELSKEEKDTTLWKLPNELQLKENIQQEQSSEIKNSLHSIDINDDDIKHNEEEEREMEKESILNKYNMKRTNFMEPSTQEETQLNNYVQLGILLLFHSNEAINKNRNEFGFKWDSFVSMEMGNVYIEDQIKKLKENVKHRNTSIILFFKQMPSMIKKENNLYSFQVKYLLHFLKIINEEVYVEIAKLQPMEPFIIQEKKESKEKNKITKFQLHVEDTQFLNKNIKKESCQMYCPHLECPFINHRYQYKSVQESIKIILDFVNSHRGIERIQELSKKNQYSFKKMETYLVLNDFLTADIWIVLEKDKKEFVHAILFLPFEMKRTVIIDGKESNQYFVERQKNRNFINEIEIIMMYNSLKQKYNNSFCLNIIEASELIHIEKKNYYEMDNEITNEVYYNSFISSDKADIFLNYILTKQKKSF